MIRIQKLKQPKITSGQELGPGDSFVHQGIQIKNFGKHTYWVDEYIRKKPKKKSGPTSRKKK